MPWWSWSRIPNVVAGAIPSSLFYPASGMPLALAMFGVSLTLYIVMAVVRMYMYIYIHIYVYTYIRMVRMARSLAHSGACLHGAIFPCGGKKVCSCCSLNRDGHGLANELLDYAG